MTETIYRHLLAATVGVLVLSLVACDDDVPVVSTLQLERHGWDSLRATASFAEPTWWGGERPLQPDAVQYYLFDSQYDTLYAGTRGAMGVPDRHLADEEALLVEVCADLGQRSICEQEGTAASPKRIEAAPEVRYPAGGNTAHGSYTLDLTVERRRFDDSGWEPIEPRGLEAYMEVYVIGRVEDAVRVPLEPGQGTFQLSGRPGYDDFAFALDSRLYDEQHADVRFDLYAALNDQAEQVASIERTVREKLPSEHRRQVAALVRLAARNVLERLTDDGSEPRVSAYVDDWRFNAISERYTIDVELTWEDGAWFFGGRHRLDGELSVDAGGHDARFVMQGGNGRGERRWHARMEGDEMVLPDLDVAEALAASSSVEASDPM